MVVGLPNQGDQWCYMNAALQLIAALGRADPSMNLAIVDPSEREDGQWQESLQNLLMAMVPRGAVQPPDAEAVEGLHMFWREHAKDLSVDFTPQSTQDAGITVSILMGALRTPRGLISVVTQRTCNHCKIPLVVASQDSTLILRVPPARGTSRGAHKMQDLVNTFYTVGNDGGRSEGSNCPSCKKRNGPMATQMLQCGDSDTVLVVRFAREYENPRARGTARARLHSLAQIEGWEAFHIPYPRNKKLEYRAVAATLWRGSHYITWISKEGGGGRSYLANDNRITPDAEFPGQDYQGYVIGAVAYVSDFTGLDVLSDIYDEEEASMRLFFNRERSLPVPTEALWEYMSRLPQPSHLRILSPRMPTDVALEQEPPDGGRLMCLRAGVPAMWHVSWASTNPENKVLEVEQYDLCAMQKLYPTAWSIYVMWTNDLVRPSALFNLETVSMPLKQLNVYACWSIFSCLILLDAFKRLDRGWAVRDRMGSDWAWLDFDMLVDVEKTNVDEEALRWMRPVKGDWLQRTVLLCCSIGLNALIRYAPPPALGSIARRNDMKIPIEDDRFDERHVLVMPPCGANELWNLSASGADLLSAVGAFYDTTRIVIVPLNINGTHWVLAVLQLLRDTATVLFIDSQQRYGDITDDGDLSMKVGREDPARARNSCLEVLVPLRHRLQALGYKTTFVTGGTQFAYQEDSWACGFHVFYWMLEAVDFFCEGPYVDVRIFHDSRIPKTIKRQALAMDQWHIDQLTAVFNHSVDMQRAYLYRGGTTRKFARMPNGDLIPNHYVSPLHVARAPGERSEVIDSSISSDDEDSTDAAATDRMDFLRWVVFNKEAGRMAEYHARLDKDERRHIQERQDWRERLRRGARNNGDASAAVVVPASVAIPAGALVPAAASAQVPVKPAVPAGALVPARQKATTVVPVEHAIPVPQDPPRNAEQLVLPPSHWKEHKAQAQWTQRGETKGVPFFVLAGKGVMPSDVTACARLFVEDAALAGVELVRLHAVTKNPRDRVRVVLALTLCSNRETERDEIVKHRGMEPLNQADTWVWLELLPTGDKTQPEKARMLVLPVDRTHHTLAVEVKQSGTSSWVHAMGQDEALATGLFLRNRLLGLWDALYNAGRNTERVITAAEAGDSGDKGVFLHAESEEWPLSESRRSTYEALFGEEVELSVHSPLRRERVGLKFTTPNCSTMWLDERWALRSAEALLCNVENKDADGKTTDGAVCSVGGTDMRASVRDVRRARVGVLVVEACVYIGRKQTNPDIRAQMIWHQSMVTEALLDLRNAGLNLVLMLYVWQKEEDMHSFVTPSEWVAAMTWHCIIPVISTPNGFALPRRDRQKILGNSLHAFFNTLAQRSPMAGYAAVPRPDVWSRSAPIYFTHSVIVAPPDDRLREEAKSQPMAFAEIVLHHLPWEDLWHSIETQTQNLMPHPYYLAYEREDSVGARTIAVLCTHHLDSHRPTHDLPVDLLAREIERLYRRRGVRNVIILNVRNNPCQLTLRSMSADTLIGINKVKAADVNVAMRYVEAYMDRYGIFKMAHMSKKPEPIWLHDATDYKAIAECMAALAQRADATLIQSNQAEVYGAQMQGRPPWDEDEQ